MVVVSMPCCELFDRQDGKYQEATLGTCPRIAVEAGSSNTVGKNTSVWKVILSGWMALAFGPAEELYKFFGITLEEVVDAVKNCIK